MRNYVLATVVPVIAVVSVVLLVSESFIDTFLSIISFCVCFPIAMMGLYMYLRGTGERWINGVDWRRMTPDEVRSSVSFWGLYMLVGSLILAVSINILISHMLVANLLIVVSIIVMIYPVARIHPGCNIKPFTERSRNGKVGIYLVVLVVCSASLFLPTLTGDGSQAVRIDLGDDEFSVKAPMFDRTFSYSDIEELEYDPHFDKGSRVMGYDTGTISSGRFKNDVFGQYQLASYTKIAPCVWIKVNGQYCAFNQSTEDDTYDVFLHLKTKTGL